MFPSFPLTGLILAGGKSRRMGTNKALIPLLGRPMIQWVLERIRPFCEEIWVVGGEAEDYRFLNVPTVKDRIPQMGPLGGLYTGLLTSSSEWNLVVSCDAPFLPTTLIKHLVLLLRQHSASGYQLFLPATQDKDQPLSALYSKKCLPVVQQLLTNQELALKRLFSFVPTLRVPWREPWIQVNTPQDFQRIKSQLYNCKEEQPRIFFKDDTNVS